jgi:hypothetical protein
LNHFSGFLAVFFLSAALLFASAAQAMQIRQFDKMAPQDQADYIHVLVEGSQRILIGQGKTDLAAKVNRLFTEVHPGDTMPLGMIEFENDLAILRVDDAQEAIKDPSAPRLEAEDVMVSLLHKSGIELPDSFYTVARNFHPKLPPQQSTATQSHKVSPQ